MNASPHPVAQPHLPAFITQPGETDTLMVVMCVILIMSVMAFGSLFFRLHTLPERMAHRSHKLQFEIVAVLGLLALFTHIHLFWVAGLLLALIDIPDFGGSLNRIAGSTEKLAGLAPGEGAFDTPPRVTDEPVDITPASEVAPAPAKTVTDARPQASPATDKGPAHA